MELINNEKSLKAADLLTPGEKSFTKTCLETGLFSEIITILGHLTKEFKREKVGKDEDESEEESEEELQVHTNAGIAGFECDSDDEAKKNKPAADAQAHAFIGSTTWNFENYLQGKQDRAK